MMKSAAKDVVANRDDNPGNQEESWAKYVRVLKQTCKKLWATLHVLNKSKAPLELELKRSNQNKSRVEQLLKSANAKNKLLEVELDSWKRELESTKYELESTRNDVQSTKGELQSMKDELESTKNELQSVKNQFELTKAEHQSLKSELDSTKDELQSIEGELKSMKKREVDLQQQVRHMQQQHADHSITKEPAPLLPMMITDQHDNYERSSSLVTLTSANVTEIATGHFQLLRSCQNLVDSERLLEGCIRLESAVNRYYSVIGSFLSMLIVKIGRSELDRQIKRTREGFLTWILNAIICLIESCIQFNMDQLTGYSKPILQYCNAQEPFANRSQLQRVPAPFRNMNPIAFGITNNCIMTLLRSSLLQNADESGVDQHLEDLKPQQRYRTGQGSLITEFNSQLATFSMENAKGMPNEHPGLFLSVPTMMNCTHLQHLNLFQTELHGSSVGQYLEVLKPQQPQQHYHFSQEFRRTECHSQLATLSIGNGDGMPNERPDFSRSMPTLTNCTFTQLKDLDSFQEELNESSIGQHLEGLKPQQHYRTSQALIRECNSQLATLSMANFDEMSDDFVLSMPAMTNGTIIQPTDLGASQEELDGNDIFGQKSHHDLSGNTESIIRQHLEGLEPQQHYRSSNQQSLVTKCHSQLATLSMANVDGMPNLSMSTMSSRAMMMHLFNSFQAELHECSAKQLREFSRSRFKRAADIFLKIDSIDEECPVIRSRVVKRSRTNE